MLTRASLKNPYAVFAICMIMLVLGAVFYQKMRVDISLEIKIPTILATTFYRGLSPSGEKILSFLKKHKMIAGHSDFHETDCAFLRGDHLARCFDPAALPLVVPMENSLIS
jgi:hypothetical protein